MWSLVQNEITISERYMENGSESMRTIDYSSAENEAITQLMEVDKRIYCMGQGINDPVGYWNITTGLSGRFGTDRVFDTPLSENGMMGVAIGSALAGMRPIYFHNRPDFLWLTMDQLVNHGTKYSYMSGGQCHVPMVIWAATGKGWGSGAQHSQALQAIFMHVPGCKVVMPTTPYDAKGLLISSVIDDNPVLFLEHRNLINQKGAVPEEMYKIELGKGVIRRSGSDITLLGISLMVPEMLKVAERLADDGIDAEVIDLRTIKPWDRELVMKSVEKTGRLAIADTSWKTGGVSAEIAASIYEVLFSNLKAPILRLGNKDVPAPSGYSLENAFYEDADSIYQKIREQFFA